VTSRQIDVVIIFFISNIHDERNLFYYTKSEMSRTEKKKLSLSKIAHDLRKIKIFTCDSVVNKTFTPMKLNDLSIFHYF
jgi:hypothetical protein